MDASSVVSGSCVRLKPGLNFHNITVCFIQYYYFNFHSTLHTPHSLLAYWLLFILHFSLYCTVHFFTLLYSTLHTPYLLLLILHFSLYTLHSLFFCPLLLILFHSRRTLKLTRDKDDSRQILRCMISDFLCSVRRTSYFAYLIFYSTIYSVLFSSLRTECHLFYSQNGFQKISTSFIFILPKIYDQTSTSTYSFSLIKRQNQK